MFNSTAYTSVAPAGTAKAIILSSDGESSVTPTASVTSRRVHGRQFEYLAPNSPAAAWAQGISVYVVFYYHGSDSDAERRYCSPLSKGRDLHRSSNPAQIPVSLESLFHGAWFTASCSEG